MKVSVLYGKKITNAQGIRGYVLGVYSQDGKITALECADGDENLFYVNFKNVLSVKERITFCGDGDGECTGRPVRLGKPVYDCFGNLLGILSEITADGEKLKYAHVGKHKFSYGDIICGDAVIVRNSARILRSDVVKNGKVLIKRGTPVTEEVLNKAAAKGEYVQTSLKCL